MGSALTRSPLGEIGNKGQRQIQGQERDKAIENLH